MLKELILNILASGLFQTKIEMPGSVDWDSVLQESYSQSVLPLVYSAVEEKIPEDIKANWLNKYYSILGSNARVNAAHSYLHQLLEQNQINYVILKGCASSRFYSNPGFRAMGDVDFLVNQEDREKCADILVKTGMKKYGDEEHAFHWEYKYNDITYELHWDAPGIPSINDENIRKYLRGILKDRVLVHDAFGDYYVPDDFHHGLVLLLHTASHMTASGVGLRHLCDWAVFVGHIDESAFIQQFEIPLKECGLWQFARVLTALSSKYLGLPEKTWASGVSDSLLTSLMDDIWDGGNFGTKNQHRITFAGIGRNEETRKIERNSFIVNVMKALNSKAEKRFPGLTRYPVTYPIAWIAVIIRYLYRVITGKSSSFDAGKDIDMIQKRNDTFRQLHLFEAEQDLNEEKT